MKKINKEINEWTLNIRGKTLNYLLLILEEIEVVLKRVSRFKTKPL